MAAAWLTNLVEGKQSCPTESFQTTGQPPPPPPPPKPPKAAFVPIHNLCRLTLGGA